MRKGIPNFPPEFQEDAISNMANFFSKMKRKKWGLHLLSANAQDTVILSPPSLEASTHATLRHGRIPRVACKRMTIPRPHSGSVESKSLGPQH